MDASSCFHCGLDIEIKNEILFDNKAFCCAGCKIESHPPYKSSPVYLSVSYL